MEEFLEKARVLEKFFDISASRKNEGSFALHKIERARLLEIICTKKADYLEVNLEELYTEFKSTRKQNG